MKRSYAVVVGVVLVVALGWWWWGRGDRDAASPDPAGRAGHVDDLARGARARRVDPRTLDRATIAGRVTDRAKRPIAGATVCADGWSRDAPGDVFERPTCVRADARGSYQIDGLLAASYAVSAAARPYRPGAYEVPGKPDVHTFALAAGETRTGVDLVLDEGGVEITGTVADISGGPVAHAQVRASAGRWGGQLGPPVETDDEGRFSLWTRPGGVRVSSAADGYAAASEYGQAPGTFELLLTPESSLTGVVVDARTGAPIEGARVAVQGAGFGIDRHADRSDAQGRFRVHGLTPGRYVAEATIEHGYGRTEGSTRVGLGQHVEGIVVRVHPAARIQGKVVIAGASPKVCEDGHAFFHDDAKDLWVPGLTDPDGTITADGVMPGTYSVRAGCRGYANVEPRLAPVVVADQDVLGLEWKVEPGATIEGRVLNKRGEPIADVELRARSTGGGARDPMQWASATSDRDGHYELRGLRAGSYRIDPETSKAVGPRDGFTIDAPAGKAIARDLVLDDGGTITGVVVDDRGAPVAGVKVDAQAIDAGFSFRWGGGAKTDATGRFTLAGLRPGAYRVLATRGRFEALRKPGTTDDDPHPGERATVRAGATTEVRLVVEAQTGTITGSVVDAAGQPVPDAYVSAARESDAAGARRSSVSATRDEFGWGDDKPALTSVDGTFAIERLSPGTYTVRAYRKGGGEAVAEHVALGHPVRLQILPTGSIEGVARRTSGAPPDLLTVQVADATTGLRREEKFYKTGGKFAIHDLPKGHFELTASADGGTKTIEVELAEGETRGGLEVVFEALATITGRVVDRTTRQPVPGMRVFAAPATGGGGMSFRFGMDDDNSNISDQDGRFTVKRVPRGKVFVQGVAKDFQNADYGFFRVLADVSGDAATVDVGDVPVIRKRVRDGEPSGELGINFVQQPRETPPAQRKLEVSFIDPKGPAAASGIEVGDVITSVDGVDATGGNLMQAWTLLNAPPGTRIELGLARGVTVAIVLAAP